MSQGARNIFKCTLLYVTERTHTSAAFYLAVLWVGWETEFLFGDALDHVTYGYSHAIIYLFTGFILHCHHVLCKFLFICEFSNKIKWFQQYIESCLSF